MGQAQTDARLAGKGERPPVPPILAGSMIAGVMREARKSGLFAADEIVRVYAARPSSSGEEFVLEIHPSGQVILARSRITK